MRTELQRLLVIPSFTPHPVQLHGELARHRHLRDWSPATHRQVQELPSPLRILTYDRVGGLDQQEAHQSVALLTDVS